MPSRTATSGEQADDGPARRCPRFINSHRPGPARRGSAFGKSELVHGWGTGGSAWGGAAGYRPSRYSKSASARPASEPTDLGRPLPCTVGIEIQRQSPALLPHGFALQTWWPPPSSSYVGGLPSRRGHPPAHRRGRGWLPVRLARSTRRLWRMRRTRGMLLVRHGRVPFVRVRHAAPAGIGVGAPLVSGNYASGDGGPWDESTSSRSQSPRSPSLQNGSRFSSKRRIFGDGCRVPASSCEKYDLLTPRRRAPSEIERCWSARTLKPALSQRGDDQPQERNDHPEDHHEEDEYDDSLT